jgi:LysR family transcriptional regulator of gallate degradation
MDPTTRTEAHIRLHGLRVFLAIAESGSVSRGAEITYRAPSALTRSLAALEQALGVALFERRPRGMLLNASGDRVHKRALRIRDEAQQATEEFCRASAQPGSVRTAVASLFDSERKLALLVWLADLRNLSAVAARLQLSQSGASMALSRIESGVGEPLFQRMAQGLVPTDPTVRLVVRAKRIFAELRHLMSDLSALAGDPGGVVTIGTLPLGRTWIVPTAIAAALDKYPALQVTTIESPFESLMGNLRSGDVDLVFGALRPHQAGQGVVTEALFHDRMGIVARTGHPLARRHSISLAELLAERWILPRLDAPGRRLVEASFQELGLPMPTAAVETGDLAMMRQLLLRSDMLTAISPHQLLFEIRAGSLIELPVTLGNTTRAIGLTLREGAMLSPAAVAVIDEIRVAAGQHQTV